MSTAVKIRAPDSTTASILSSRIALDVSAFFTANVPPNPQHSSASGQVGELQAPDGAEQPDGAVADPKRAKRVTGRVVRHARGERRTDVRRGRGGP